jgi:hypothetical protein
LTLACAVALTGGLTLMFSPDVDAKPPCKPCKDKPYCGCTYNGMPRVSCEPCCWGYGGPQICAD